MILIFGGAYQGKLSHALERFHLTEDDVYRCSGESAAAPGNKKIIYEIDKWILAMLKNEKSDIEIRQAAERFLENNPDAIVICNDISCGIVPVDPLLRKWRDSVGRSLAMISKKSCEVIRMFFSIPTRIK